MALSATASPAGWNRRVWRLALPIILSNLTVPLLSAVDTAVVGRLPGPEFLGGAALGGLIFSFLFWGFGFLRMGTTGLAAQAHGADAEQELRLVLFRGLALALLLGAGIVALQAPLFWAALKLFQASPAVEASASDYLQGRIWSAPATLGNYVVLGWLLGRQRARLGLCLQLVITGANVPLSIVLGLWLGYGVAGVAAATAISEWTGFAAGLAVVWGMLRPEPLPRRLGELLQRRALLQLLAVNRDIFIRTICLLLAFGHFADQGARMGDVVLAANAVLLTFQTFTAYGLDGLAHAAEALVGAAVGARDRSAFRASLRASLLSAMAMAAAFALALAALGEPLIHVLTPLPEVREAAGRYLVWAVLSPLISVWSFQLDGVFIGATRTAELRNAMVASLAVFLVAAWALVPAFGNHGLWAALMVLMAARAGSLLLYLPRLDAALRADGPG